MDGSSSDDYGGFVPQSSAWDVTNASRTTTVVKDTLGILIPVIQSRQARLAHLREREAVRRAQVKGTGVAAINPSPSTTAAAAAILTGPGTADAAGGDKPKLGPGLSLSTPKTFGGRSARASNFFSSGAGYAGGGGAGPSAGGGPGAGLEPGDGRHGGQGGVRGKTSIFQTDTGVEASATPIGGGNDSDAAAAAAAAAGTAGASPGQDGSPPPVSSYGGDGPAGEADVSVAETMLHNAGLEDSYQPEAVVEMSGPPPLDLSDVRRFINTPAPKGTVVQCYIRRNKSGKKRMFPTYTLFEQSTDTMLLAARKRKKSKSSNYLVSLDPEDMARDSVNYVGKLRSNFIGTSFTFYDHGEAPNKVRPGQDVRRELSAVLYESNILGFKGPRKMTVLIPAMRRDGTPHVWRPDAQGRGLIATYKASGGTAGTPATNPAPTAGMDQMLALVNKPPTWSEDTQSYVLNFSRRVTLASVKNFQIVHPNESASNGTAAAGGEPNPAASNYIIMQFGRTGDHQFTMDYRYPMTALQAFGIALSSFDNKLACE